MHQSRFEEAHRADWQELDRLLNELEQRSHSTARKGSLERIPLLYRRVCGHYSLALRRYYTSGLVDRLHALILRGHRHIYKQRGQTLQELAAFCHSTFPLRVRKAWRYVVFSLLMFYLPALILGWCSYRDATFIYSLMPPERVAQMERMYDTTDLAAGETIVRDKETDFAMFGHYISHNISIGFRTFAGGMLFGIGALFALLYNGAIIGSVAGHLSHAPYAAAFWPFVAGHSAWELTAIALCGAAGLMLGAKLLQPGPYRRLDALRHSALEALQLVLGAALMLVFAAVIEAFWSAQPLPLPVKYGFSLANWVLVLLYLCTSGKNSHAA
ncbi:MAG: stage II sporulation protein M [bacterium]|nr:stage II sporulation protein M [bacterium]